ncbi:NTF2 fold immunity protein [Pseudomonas syringae group genomosp. 3]|uniref:NTF2 fold immunity protein n=1 Tax=Pseudomonas syringae group genomosp. 3 TaxID=251701 RepID=UPI000CF0FDF5|nr:NTF2 fold immunity protein [Pseudomonas syringae group genomosp. 3]
MDKHSKTNATEIILSERVRHTFYAFATAMYNWEKEFYRERLEALDDNGCRSALLEQGHADLSTIFSAYVTKKGKNYDRLENLVCGANPEYEINGKTVKISVTRKNTATVIFEKNSGSFESYRLNFTEIHGVLKIQRRSLNDEGKWLSVHV